jgi:glycosyltransferase involved in cell wall biosynthesis
MELVSVVIAAYNAEQWIGETITSVLRQTYENVEVILIDDGSTDQTVRAAESVLRKGPFQFRIFHQENRGASAARNYGCLAARGKWIQFLDADDLLDPSKIELQVRQKPVGMTPDVIYSDWQKLCWTDSVWKKSDHVNAPLIGHDTLADLLQSKNFIALGSQLFSSEALRGVGGFDESHRLIEDVELHIKIAMGGGIFVKVLSNRPLFWYRDGPQSLSKSNRTEFVEGCIRNAKLVERYVRRRQSWSTEIVEAIVAVYYHGARYFAEHDWERFEELLADIEALRPAFLPIAPVRLRALSRVLGYRNAERASGFCRRLKRLGRVPG